MCVARHDKEYAWPLHPNYHKQWGNTTSKAEHLASLELCLHTSAARAAGPTITLTSTNVLEFNYVSVTVGLKSAGLAKSQ